MGAKDIQMKTSAPIGVHFSTLCIYLDAMNGQEAATNGAVRVGSRLSLLGASGFRNAPNYSDIR